MKNAREVKPTRDGYSKNKEQIKEKSQRHYHAQNGVSKAKEYYKTNKKRLQEKAQNCYKNLPEKEKSNMEHGRNQHKYICER